MADSAGRILGGLIRVLAFFQHSRLIMMMLSKLHRIAVFNKSLLCASMEKHYYCVFNCWWTDIKTAFQNTGLDFYKHRLYLAGWLFDTLLLFSSLPLCFLDPGQDRWQIHQAVKLWFYSKRCLNCHFQRQSRLLAWQLGVIRFPPQLCCTVACCWRAMKREFC